MNKKKKEKKRFRGTLHDYYMCTYVMISFKIPFFLFTSNFFCDYESSLAPSFFLLFLFPSFRRTYTAFAVPFPINFVRERTSTRLFFSPVFFSSLFFFLILFSFVTRVQHVKARSSAGRGTRRKHKHPPIDLSWSRRILVSPGFFALRQQATSACDPTIDR